MRLGQVFVRIGLSCLALLGLAFGDSTSVTVTGAGSGDLQYFTQQNGTNFLLRLQIFGATNGYNGQITLQQTHQYVGNQFIEITPQALTDQFYSWPGANRDVNLYSYYIAYATTDAKRFGRFQLLITGFSESPFAQVDQRTFEFDVTAPLEFGGGTGITPTDLNDQPVNQGGFWSNVLGPDEDSLNRLSNTLQAISTWGPLNIYAELRDLLGTATTPDYENVYLGFGTYDLSFMSDALRAARLVFSISLWVAVVLWFWNKFLAKV